MGPEELSSYVQHQGLDKLFELDVTMDYGLTGSVDPSFDQVFAPNLADLVRLHVLCVSRKVTTVLEFGCGYSTAVLSHALHANAQAHGAFVRNNLRRANAFEVHTVDNEEKYLETAKSRLPKSLSDHAHFHFSTVSMTTFDGRIVTQYDRLPNICPDLILLDGPGQHGVMGDINGISTAHPDRLPMTCDILKFEHFLLPGTLIVVDGRAANARFLKTNLQRDWRYYYDQEGDVHYLELKEPPLGRLNRRQIVHCLGEKWLNDL